MKPKCIKKILLTEIKKVVNNIRDYCNNPDKDFTRNRKLPIERIIKGIIGMKSGSLTNELLDLFEMSPETPTTSAFIQQRSKIKPEAFETIFKGFSKEISNSFNDDMEILAVDGSKIQIPTDETDTDSYFPGTNGQKPYNLLHLNCLFNLNHCIYSDAIIQKSKYANEHKALTDMVDHSDISKALIIADRGYESYNNLAHIQEKGWFYLIRIKDGKSGIKEGLELPESDSFDVDISLQLTRKQTKEIKELFKDKNHYRFVSSTTIMDYLPLKNKKSEPAKFYELSFRIVRFEIAEGLYETVITNLEREKYKMDELKELYALRWGIETSFRDLKYTLGMLNFHSKKVMCIQQEIYAHLIMYNFAEMITSHVAISKKQGKYTYKVNFSVSVHICRLFYQGKTTSPNLEAVIAKNLIPIRPNRHWKRKTTRKIHQSFFYRVA